MTPTEKNEEMNDLLTHQAGATNIHMTRKTDKPVIIEPPEVPTTGATGYKPTDDRGDMKQY